MSAEYEWAKERTSDQTWGAESKAGTDDTFQAELQTIEFRIIETSVTIAQDIYESLLQDKTFAVTYIRDASSFAPKC